MPVPGQGIYTLAYDAKSHTVVGNTWPDGHFFSYDLRSGKFKDHGAIAGHRTTFLAPFAHIERLRRGDRVTLELPYAQFVYRISGHRIVAADELSVLRSPRRELLALQACHPRFFATHRYIAYARPVLVRPKGGQTYAPPAAAR